MSIRIRKCGALNPVQCAFLLQIPSSSYSNDLILGESLQAMLYWVRTGTCGSWSRSTQWVACRTHLNSTASHLSSPVRACPATSSNDFNFNSKLLLGSCLMIYTYCYIHMDECTTRLRKTITISIATTWGILDPNTQILWFAWSDGEGLTHIACGVKCGHYHSRILSCPVLIKNSIGEVRSLKEVN